jgi:hypothetical protein
MVDLRSYGFVHAGMWHPSDTVKSGIVFQLISLSQERVAYAFLVDGEPKYVGVCERHTTTLGDRMRRYQSRAGAGTNARIAKQIERCLQEGRTVHIFALKPDMHLQYRDLEVDLVKGLENPLIEKLRPEWNIAVCSPGASKA